MFSLTLVGVIVVAASSLLLGLVTLVSNSGRRSNRIFGALSGTVAIFSVVNYLADYDPSHAIFWARGTFFLGAFMAWGMLSFVSNFPNRYGNPLRERLLFLGAVFVAVASYTPMFIPSISLQIDKTTVNPGPAYIIFPIYVSVVFAFTVRAIFTALKKGAPQDRLRTRIVATGLAVSACILLLTNLLIPAIVGTDGSASYGSIAFTAFIALTTYAIIRHRLFDVRFIVARSITYILLLVTLTAGYVALAFGVSRLFFSGNAGTLGQTVVYAVLSLVLAFVFQPLRRSFERLTDHLFYRDRYDGREVLDGISRILVSEINIDRMLSRSLDLLCREMKIQFGQIIIFSGDRVYRVGHFGPLPKRLMVAPDLRRLGSGMVVADTLTTGERKTLLESHDLRLSLGLKTGEEFVGYLLLGDKLSGNGYDKTDVSVLAIIGKELAVGISNAKAYAEIQAFNRTLQERVDQATSRLRVANRHLTELDKTKDEFISMASHQLRTPLTTIKGYLSMMTEGDAGRLTATQREFVGYAFDASERMVNLISDLLNVSRLQAGRFLIEAKPTDIGAVVADEVRQLQQHAVNKGLELVYVAPEKPLPEVEIDENKTRQVIMNFIDNAIYYTKQGSVTVKLSGDTDSIRLEVTDTGIGVPEAAKKKLFSKFFRAANAQGIRPDGTGLGLYLARRVIADQNGTIIFKSSEGHGSTFGFELPLVNITKKVNA